MQPKVTKATLAVKATPHRKHLNNRVLHRKSKRSCYYEEECFGLEESKNISRNFHGVDAMAIKFKRLS